LEIRKFCIGILINRASGNFIHDNRIVANRGGAGVMLTGDDGSGNPTATTTVQNKVLRNDFLDNGDGLELTRGAGFNLVANNVFRSTNANPEPSQGIEVLFGNDNVVVRNRFEGYSDGIQVNSGHRNYIGANTFFNNTFGLSLTGFGNIVEGNRIFGNAVGVAVRAHSGSPRVRFSQNNIFGNGQKIERCQVGGSCDPTIRKGGIVFGLPGPEYESYVGTRGGGVTPDPTKLLKICPNGGVAAPVLDRARRSGTQLTIEGHLKGSPQARFTVEVFGNRQKDSAEGETFLGEAVTVSDHEGNASFTLVIDSAALETVPASFTATSTSSEGATSEFSRPITLPD
jgi:3-dehydroshikimate dehydratase